MFKCLFALFILVSAAIPVWADDLPLPNTLIDSSVSAAKVGVDMRLADIKTIFVAPLGTDEGAELVRQKVINKIIREKLFNVVESPSNADAVLTGASGVSHRHHLILTNSFIGTTTRYSAECVVRLISKNQQVLWSDDTSTRRVFAPHSARSASSTVAEKLVNDLSKAIELERMQVAVSRTGQVLGASRAGRLLNPGWFIASANSYSERQSKTRKYQPNFPNRFGSI